MTTRPRRLHAQHCASRTRLRMTCHINDHINNHLTSHRRSASGTKCGSAGTTQQKTYCTVNLAPQRYQDICVDSGYTAHGKTFRARRKKIPAKRKNKTKRNKEQGKEQNKRAKPSGSAASWARLHKTQLRSAPGFQAEAVFRLILPTTAVVSCYNQPIIPPLKLRDSIVEDNEPRCLSEGSTI